MRHGTWLSKTYSTCALWLFFVRYRVDSVWKMWADTTIVWRCWRRRWRCCTRCGDCLRTSDERPTGMRRQNVLIGTGRSIWWHQVVSSLSPTKWEREPTRDKRASKSEMSRYVYIVYIYALYIHQAESTYGAYMQRKKTVYIHFKFHSSSVVNLCQRQSEEASSMRRKRRRRRNANGGGQNVVFVRQTLKQN